MPAPRPSSTGSAVSSPIGSPTRGTTNPNRLRRMDRWLVDTQHRRWAHQDNPLFVDLGYGANATTALELFDRLRRRTPDAEVIGIEIDQHRVAAALPLARPGLTFQRGGFELGTDRPPLVVRAFNVLRQYPESEYAAHWATVTDRLAPGGLFIDGTCDEIGRRAAWIAIGKIGPESLSISMRFGSFELPSDIAERLPKALIHRNVPGERIHALLAAMDAAWTVNAPLASFGNRQRWIAMCRALKDSGVPVLGGVSRWRLGEVTIAWDALA
nr:methylase [Haematomicrobium sanguinis]